MSEHGNPQQVMTALITGAAGGIGLATVKHFLKAGCNVVAVDVNRELLAASEKRLEASRMSGYASCCADVSDPSAVEAIGALARERFGRIDILVNNAGISPKIGKRSPKLMEVTLDSWQRTYDVNVTSVLLTCQAFVPAMRDAGWGRVVNISSLAGRTKSVVAGPTYSATKAALIGFTRTVAAELASSGVTVNAIAPGRIDTPMAQLAGPETNAIYVAQIPAGRMGRPDEVAAAVAYLASDAAGFVTGVTLDVNGGFFMA